MAMTWEGQLWKAWEAVEFFFCFFSLFLDYGFFWCVWFCCFVCLRDFNDFLIKTKYGVLWGVILQVHLSGALGCHVLTCSIMFLFF